MTNNFYYCGDDSGIEGDVALGATVMIDRQGNFLVKIRGDNDNRLVLSKEVGHRFIHFLDLRKKLETYNQNIFKETNLPIFVNHQTIFKETIFPYFVNHRKSGVFDYFIRAYEEKSIIGDIRISYNIVYFTDEVDAVVFGLSI